MQEVTLNTQDGRKDKSRSLVEFLYTIKGIAESHLEDIQHGETMDQKELLVRASRALSDTVEQANRVIEMINHFRSVTSVVSAPAKKPSTSIHDSVYQVVHAMLYEFPFNRITVVKILPHDLAPVAIEREHFEAILFQLLYQARQNLGDMAGIITVEAMEKDYLTADNKHRRRSMIRVSDTGPAIPEENLPHVFDPFFTSSGARGTNGLGLYIVKKLADLNRGSVRVESSERGNSFYLEFLS